MDIEVTGTELLDLAQQTLEEQIVPQLSGKHRYVAQMIGVAIRIVAREIVQEDHLLKAGEALLVLAAHPQDLSEGRFSFAREIRDGRHDADSRVHAALWAETVIRTSISKPSVLARTERRLAGMESNDMR
jgi:hypothetical protein